MLRKSAGVDSGRVAVRWSISSYLSVLFALLGIATAEGADVLTQHYNNGRTGATLAESILNATNVASGEFQKLWTLYTDGQVVAQPLYVSDLQIDTTTNPNAPPVKGKFNAVIIATMHNTIYVYDLIGKTAERTGGRSLFGHPGWDSLAPAAKILTCGAQTIRNGASSARR